MYRYSFTKGDTGKLLRLECFEADSGPVNISGGAVTFSYWLNGLRYDKAVPITDGENGVAQDEWTTAEQNNWTAGTFPCQIKAVLPGGAAHFFPSDGSFGEISLHLAL